MRTRSVSTRKSGRISGQGFRSGCVDFFVRLAHATRENSARQTAVRIKRRTTSRLDTSRCRRSCRPTTGCDPCRRGRHRSVSNRSCPYCCWHRARPSDVHSIVGDREAAVPQCAFHSRTESQTRARRETRALPCPDRPLYSGRPPSGRGSRAGRSCATGGTFVKSSMNMLVSTVSAPGTRSAASRGCPLGDRLHVPSTLRSARRFGRGEVHRGTT